VHAHEFRTGSSGSHVRREQEFNFLIGNGNRLVQWVHVPTVVDRGIKLGPQEFKDGGEEGRDMTYSGGLRDGVEFAGGPSPKSLQKFVSVAGPPKVAPFPGGSGFNQAMTEPVEDARNLKQASPAIQRIASGKDALRVRLHVGHSEQLRPECQFESAFVREFFELRRLPSLRRNAFESSFQKKLARQGGLFHPREPFDAMSMSIRGIVVKRVRMGGAADQKCFDTAADPPVVDVK
jgi:hypothetical protein